ncbi:MAG: 7-cyano-7-deazaguanine synthase QueC [Acetobacter sp.]|nr:7-cyano-7-deazaguanine synthase QueC [Acetobacter sp.]
MPISSTLCHESALVLFSGGQDSTTCLAWALERFAYVETLGFDYRQRHRVELTCRTILREGLSQLNVIWASRLGLDHILPLQVLHTISDTALTCEAEIVISKNGLPNTFVPGRNLLFLTLAAALAARRGIRHIVSGVCETDFSGYPDCRDDTIKALQVTLNLGMNSHYVLHTPLMWLNKAETWCLAEQLGGQAMVTLIKRESHTCYLGDHSTWHDWGYGCNTCPACHLRKTGWETYQMKKSVHA